MRPESNKVPNSARFLIALTLLSRPPFITALELRASVMDDYLPRFEDKENFNENWSYQIYLNGGIQLYVELSRLNKGNDKFTTANLFLIKFLNKNRYVTCQYPADKYFSGKRDRNGYEIVFHKNIYISGNNKNQRLKFFRKKEKVRYFADLSFRDFAPGVSTVENIRMKSGERIGFTVHFPRSGVKGRIAVDNDTLDVSGFGYLDHIYQSNLATGLYHRGIRYFGLSKEIDAGFVFVGNKKNGNNPIGISAKGSDNNIQWSIPKGLGKSQEVLKFANATLGFSPFKEQHKWSVLDEIPKGLGYAAGLFVKDMVLTRGIGGAKNRRKYMITKMNIE